MPTKLKDMMRGIRIGGVDGGFTMIELLVVIAVIGILAVALLATLNPLEQIRKGRDTRTRADMSQLNSAIERYNASLGYFPWQASESENLTAAAPDIDFLQIGGTGGSATVPGCTVVTPCTVADALQLLSDTAEVKSAFIDRIADAGYEITWLYYNDENTGASIITCFTPQSNTFSREAFDRCKAGSSWGSDFLTTAYGGAGSPCPDSDAATYATASFDSADADEMICLP